MGKIILPASSSIHQTLQHLVQSCDMIFFSGLPGVGKSLLLQQTTLLAQQAGRKTHLFQMDVIRPAFESDQILTRYPGTDGITHPVILKAVGLWTRSAVLNWHRTYASPDYILIGEVPLIGNRLMELAKPYDDDPETILSDEKTHFVIPVPTREVRQIIENKRKSTIMKPPHEKERLDAPPNVMHAVWQSIYLVAHELGLTDRLLENPPYSPEIYSGVYEHLLQSRNATKLLISEVFDPADSVYVLDTIEHELSPNPDEVQQIMSQLEHDFTQEQIEAQVSQWYII